MKGIKKLMIAVTAFTMCAASAAAISACEKHEHSYKWDVTTPATCTQEGVNTGVCECGDKKTEPIAAKGHSYVYDETAATCEEAGVKTGVCSVCKDETTETIPATGHAYGDWSVKTYPTYKTTGEAIKTCSTNKDHVVKVTLPVLPEPTGDFSAYKSVDYTEYPDAITKGKVKCVLAHEQGDIEFTMDADALGIRTVQEAIEIGVAHDNLVRRVEAKLGHSFDFDYSPQAINGVNYEKGENYTYVNDLADLYEYFYTIEEDGSFLSVSKYDGGTPMLDKDATNEDAYKLGGFGYYLNYTGINSMFGTENLISSLYEQASLINLNDDFKESVVETEDGNVYSFSYGYYNISKQYFHVITVEFTLSDKYYIENVEVTSKGYTPGNFKYDEATGTYKVTNENSKHYTDKIELQQIPAAADDEALECPYKRSDFVIQTFYITHQAGKDEQGETIVEELKDGDTITGITASSGGGDWYNVALHTEGGEFSRENDSVKLVIKNPEGQVINHDIIEHVGDVVFMENHGFRAWYGGLYTAEFSTQDITLTIYLDIAYAAPASITADVYVYNVNDNSYFWAASNEETVYVGQPLSVTSVVLNPLWEDTAFTASVVSSNSANAKLERTEIGGKLAYTFTSDAADDYTVRLASVKGSRTYDLTVHVAEAPDMAVLLSGNHLNEVKGAKVEFVPNAVGATAGEVTITDKTGTEVRTYSYADGKITTAHKSGATLNYTLIITNTYHLALSYTDSFGDEQMIVLVVEAPADLEAGEFKIATGKDSFEFAEVTAATVGVYTFSAPTGTFFLYVNGEQYQDGDTMIFGVFFGSKMTMTVAVKAGDVVRVEANSGDSAFTVAKKYVLDSGNYKLDGDNKFEFATITAETAGEFTFSAAAGNCQLYVNDELQTTNAPGIGAIAFFGQFMGSVKMVVTLKAGDNVYVVNNNDATSFTVVKTPVLKTGTYTLDGDKNYEFTKITAETAGEFTFSTTSGNCELYINGEAQTVNASGIGAIGFFGEFMGSFFEMTVTLKEGDTVYVVNNLNATSFKVVKTETLQIKLGESTVLLPDTGNKPQTFELKVEAGKKYKFTFTCSNNMFSYCRLDVTAGSQKKTLPESMNATTSKTWTTEEFAESGTISVTVANYSGEFFEITMVVTEA